MKPITLATTTILTAVLCWCSFAIGMGQRQPPIVLVKQAREPTQLPNICWKVAKACKAKLKGI